MVRKNTECSFVTAEKRFGGEGTLYSTKIIENNGELLDKGRLFNHNILMPGSSLGYHVHHGDTEIYYILSGKAEYNDNGTVVTLEAGDVTFCSDGEGHSIKNIGSTALSFVALILYQ